MEPVFYVMAILGCGDGSQQCQQARVEPAHYQTAAQCQAAMPDALGRNTDLEYPVINAVCQQRGLRMAEGGAERPRG